MQKEEENNGPLWHLKQPLIFAVPVGRVTSEKGLLYGAAVGHFTVNIHDSATFFRFDAPPPPFPVGAAHFLL